MNRRTKLLAALSGAALAVSAAYAQDPKDVPQKTGVTPNDLVVRGVDGAENLEFIVIDVKCCGSKLVLPPFTGFANGSRLRKA